MTSSRRDFLKGMAVGGMATVGAVPAIASAKQIKYDATADVVVVGFGGAGAATAISAADNGAKVLVIERQPQATLRSNTRMSGGIFHCPDKTGNRDALKAYAKAMFSGENIPGKLEGEQPEVSDGLAQAWADYTPNLVDWMQSLDPDFKSLATPGFKGAAFPTFPGAKECAYQVYRSSYMDRIPAGASNRRSYGRPKSEATSGEAFWQCLANGVAKRADKIKIMYETRGRELITNDAGEVIGVIAEQNGKKIRIKARKAVVLCSGGYEYSRTMRQAFLEGPGIEGWAFYGTTANEGDGIAMGLNVGAGMMKAGKAASRIIMPAPDRFNGMRIGMITPAVGSGRAIVVNNYGKRYAAEHKVTKDPSRYFFYKEAVKFNIDTLDYPNSPSWFIFDETLRKSKPLVYLGISTPGFGFVDYGAADNSDAIRKGWILKANTIEELAEKIRATKDNANRMDPKALAETVKQYNEYCAKGKDEAFGRLKSTLQPVSDGPFYACPLVAGGPNTKGGLACNAKREVLDWDLKPIKGLYAVGEIASALKFVYQGGGNLTECLVFGQVCGNEVAKLPNRG
ncbi:MAG: FAD-dependent oxidoreductase [Duodenibacillus sp.]|nr:FAD-dependent oxidoreductase [Duodenibacillus sp.]